MNIEELANPEVLTQPIYQPGRPIEDVAAELGLDPKTVLKLASNESPWGASPKALEAARKALDEVQIYPDGGATFLRRKLSEHWQLPEEQFVVGQGSNEVLELISHAFLNPEVEVVMGEQAFIVYKLVSIFKKAKVIEVPLKDFTHDLQAMRAAVNDRTRMVFLPSPNNPTGTANSAQEILDFARSLPEHVIFVFDAAYAEYQKEAVDLRPLIREGRKVVCTHTFSKIYGLAALRIGYGYGPAGLIRLLHQVRKPFNVDAIALAAAKAALDDQPFVQLVREETVAQIQRLTDWFQQKGLEVVPSHANFILVRFSDAVSVNRQLLEKGIIVRPLQPYGLTDYLRITTGTAAQNDRLIRTLEEILG